MALFEWEIETYRARYNTYSGSGGPVNLSFIEMESEPLGHGIHATVFLWFLPTVGSTGSVSLPSYEGSDWDYEYYLFLPADQFDTLREFLDSERPVSFEAVHDTTPIGSYQTVQSWSLNTDAGEPVGEEEGAMAYLRPFRAVPEELRPDELRDALNAVSGELDVDASRSTSPARA